ncbi:MAG: S1 RNA-binding domain-containing protein [Candidatus Micrarchaeota archaeon]|nr:S1 RNA-binding domain-containing protein [Candidatus Micrarchaeota archaeon]
MTNEEKRYPEVGELVLIEIVKILPYGAFCKILDYNGLEAFLHISEISSGWIKNIHEHVDEGKKYVAKVSKVNLEKMLFDVSLKKVTDQEKKEKNEEIKKENRAKKIISMICSGKNLDSEQIFSKISNDYHKIHHFIEDVINDKKALLKKQYPQELLDEIEKVMLASEEKKVVIISKIFHIIGKGNKGILNVKNLFSSLLTKYSNELQIKYLGSPRYLFIVKSNDHKTANKILSDITNLLLNDKHHYLVKPEAEQK